MSYTDEEERSLKKFPLMYIIKCLVRDNSGDSLLLKQYFLLIYSN